MPLKVKEKSPKNKKLEMSPVLTPEQIDDQLYTMCSKNLPLPETEIPKNIMEELYLVKDPEKVRAVGEAINFLVEVNPDILSHAFSSQNKHADKLAALFVNHPDNFVELAMVTGTASDFAFKALAVPKLSKLFATNPESVIKSFSEIIEATPRNSHSALFALATPEIAKLFTTDPELVTKSFAEMIRTVPLASTSALKALATPEIAKLFVANPESVIKSFREIEEITAGYALKALATPEIAKLFVANPESVIKSFRDIAKATPKDFFGKEPNYFYLSYAFEALATPEIAKLFATDPELVTKSFVEIAREVGPRADFAFKALGKPAVAKKFANDPGKFVKIAKTAGSNADKEFLEVK